MAFFQDWVDDLVKAFNKTLTVNSGMSGTIANWPYSGFFDWFDTAHPGFIPAIMKKSVGSLPASKAGSIKESYFVNNQYVFIGLNPNFPARTSIFSPQYMNNGNFIGFNMDSAQKPTDFSIGKAGTLSDFWKICGMMQATKYQPIYEHFKASYMTDIAVGIDTGNSGSAIDILNDPKKANHYFNCLKMELEIYKNYVFPQMPSDFPDLTFCIFGGVAYSFFIQFASGIWGKGLFHNAKIVQFYHYSRGGAVHTMQNLLSLYSSSIGKTGLATSSFPSIAPTNPTKWI